MKSTRKTFLAVLTAIALALVIVSAVTVNHKSSAQAAQRFDSIYNAPTVGTANARYNALAWDAKKEFWQTKLAVIETETPAQAQFVADLKAAVHAADFNAETSRMALANARDWTKEAKDLFGQERAFLAVGAVASAAVFAGCECNPSSDFCSGENHCVEAFSDCEHSQFGCGLFGFFQCRGKCVPNQGT